LTGKTAASVCIKALQAICLSAKYGGQKIPTRAVKENQHIRKILIISAVKNYQLTQKSFWKTRTKP
jgi:hypothetical protein